MVFTEQAHGHSLNRDIQNFAELFDGNFYEGIPQVYAGNEYVHNPDLPTLVIILGNSAVGKDEIMNPILEDGTLKHATTATTRKRRYAPQEWVSEEQRDAIKDLLDHLVDDGYLAELERLEKAGLVTLEPKTKYIWMPQLRSDMPLDEQYDNLREVYRLVEDDAHYGELYGLPMGSIEIIEGTREKRVVRTEVNGAEKIKEVFGKRFNILVVTVLPDNEDITIERLIRRQKKTGKDENLEIRIAEDREKLKKFPLVTNFYIHNTINEVNGLPGLEQSKLSLRVLLQRLGVIGDQVIQLEPGMI